MALKLWQMSPEVQTSVSMAQQKGLISFKKFDFDYIDFQSSSFLTFDTDLIRCIFYLKLRFKLKIER